MSVTTVLNKAAGLDFMTLDHVMRREAVYHDLTNDSMIARGIEVDRFSLEEAAAVLASALSRYDFVLYEYFLTDIAGHSRDMSRAAAEIAKLDTFLAHLIKAVDLNKHTLILTSDHGNIEDVSVKSHTANPVMTLLWGENADHSGIRFIVFRILPRHHGVFHRKGKPIKWQ